MLAGCVSSATSSTQERSLRCLVGTVVSIVTGGFDLGVAVYGFARGLRTWLPRTLKVTPASANAPIRTPCIVVTLPEATPRCHQSMRQVALQGFASDVQTSR